MMLHHHDPKMSRKGRTELIIGASRAKSHKEFAGGIQQITSPQNHDKNRPQRNFETTNLKKEMSGRQKMK